MSWNAARAMPRAWAATDGLDLFKEASRILNPSPGSPSRFALGTRHPSKASPQVDDPLWPILRSFDTTSKPGRSEEHTSELQSLMGISYAVFCLNKKTTIRIS